MIIKKGIGLFLRLLTATGLYELDRKSDQLRIDELANGLKVNFSGTTI